MDKIFHKGSKCLFMNKMFSNQKFSFQIHIKGQNVLQETPNICVLNSLFNFRLNFNFHPHF